MKTCARCGHTSPTCERCGRSDRILGAHIGGLDYCHNDPTPSCYMLTSWEQTETRVKDDPLFAPLLEAIDALKGQRP